MDPVAHKVLRFDRFRLDLTRGCLRAGEQEIDLRPKAFQLLTYLAANAGRLLPKQELIEAVWPNVVVSDELLEQCIRQLRRGLGDADHRLIKTVPRRGYLFDVTPSRSEVTAAAPTQTIGTSGPVQAASSVLPPPAPPAPVLALPDKPSIAVLPFSNLSGDPGQDYFTDGIVEDIITELSRFGELFVIARNSSFKYKGKAVDVRDVGHELGVRYVLEGSVRRGGDRIRITAQLIEAATGVHCWAERYDRKLEGIFAVQDEVVGTIAGILAAHVRRAETERTRSKPPNSWQAYDYYLQGADCYGTFTVSFSAEDLSEARRLLQQSLAIDPNYARSHAMLATSYCAVWANSVDNEFLSTGALDRAEQLARKAIQLDPNLPFARTVLALVLAWRRDYEASMIEVERALALNPNNLDWRLGMVLILAGHARRAVDVLEACTRLDPYCHPMTGGMQGIAHCTLGQYAQALPLLRDFAARAKSRHAQLWLAATYAQLGQLDAARAQAAELQRFHPAFTIAAARLVWAPKHAKDESRFLDALRLAGLPE